MIYNLENLDAKDIENRLQKMVVYRKKFKDKNFSDVVLQDLASSRDLINRLLKDTIYE